MPALNYVSFAPFGRGSTSTAAIITTPYATLRTLLNTTKLDSTNLHRFAGWPEAKIAFIADGGTGGHRHILSPVADSSVGTVQLNKVLYAVGETGADGSVVAFTQTPGVLMLFGVSEVQYLVAAATQADYEVKFSEGGYTNQSFLPGTIPQVMVSPWVKVTGITGASALRCAMLSADADGFIARVVRESGSPVHTEDIEIYLSWIAFGVAPGLIASPGPKALLP